jgi:hypothetical protein
VVGQLGTRDLSRHGKDDQRLCPQVQGCEIPPTPSSDEGKQRGADDHQRH